MADFKITISAVDKATATVRRVNDAVGRLTRPFEEIGQSFKSLGRELGFERIGKNLGNIGREAGGAARSIGSIVAPMAAITGVGSVAGIAALAGNWAKLGRSIDNSARGIGISSGQLQSFQGAAKMVGIDASTTTASLDGLATTMQDAQWGRNQGALLMLNKLGIGLKKSTDGAWDVVGEYKEIANAIAKEKSPQVQALIANNLGLGGMLPFLREGAAGIDRYEGMVKRLGYVMSDAAVTRSKEFSQSLAGLNIAVDGVKNSIGDKLIPVMQPLIDQFSNWLAVNREWISVDISKAAEGFATWINKIEWEKVGQGILDFGEGIGKVVDWLGGWKNAAIAVAIAMNAGLIGSVLSLGITLVRGGAGIVVFTAQLLGWKTAALEAAAANDAAAASATKGFVRKGGLLALAAVGGYEIGTQINKHFIEGTPAQDWLGDKLARGAAFLGSNEAKQAVASTDRANGVIPGGRDNAIFAMDYFQSRGWSKAAAAGIVSNGIVESSLNPKAIGDWGRARGVFQLHPDRQNNFEKWAGFRITDDRADTMKQLEFANYELTQGTEKAAGNKLRLAGNAESAGEIGSRNWLRPGLTEEAKAREAATRGALAEQLAAPVTPNAAPQGPYSQQVAQPQGGTVKVEIEHKNAPEGTKTKVDTSGNVQASSRIAYSGVGSIA